MNAFSTLLILLLVPGLPLLLAMSLMLRRGGGLPLARWAVVSRFVPGWPTAVDGSPRRSGFLRAICWLSWKAGYARW